MDQALSSFLILPTSEQGLGGMKEKVQCAHIRGSYSNHTPAVKLSSQQYCPRDDCFDVLILNYRVFFSYYAEQKRLCHWKHKIHLKNVLQQS